MIQNELPLSDQALIMVYNVLVQGVELSNITVLLHRVYLCLNLISGPVIVGVRPTLPKGVSYILGNDFTGETVKPNLYVFNYVHTLGVLGEVGQEHQTLLEKENL